MSRHVAELVMANGARYLKKIKDGSDRYYIQTIDEAREKTIQGLRENPYKWTTDEAASSAASQSVGQASAPRHKATFTSNSVVSPNITGEILQEDDAISGSRQGDLVDPPVLAIDPPLLCAQQIEQALGASIIAVPDSGDINASPAGHDQDDPHVDVVPSGSVRIPIDTPRAYPIYEVAGQAWGEDTIHDTSDLQASAIAHNAYGPRGEVGLPVQNFASPPFQPIYELVGQSSGEDMILVPDIGHLQAPTMEHNPSAPPVALVRTGSVHLPVLDIRSQPVYPIHEVVGQALGEDLNPHLREAAVAFHPDASQVDLVPTDEELYEAVMSIVD